MIGGLTQKDRELINQTLEKYPLIRQVRLFGSRAKGNHKPGSDVDLALFDHNLKGTTKELESILPSLADDLDGLTLPYFFDLVIYNTIDNERLKEHIDRVGITWYKRVE